MRGKESDVEQYRNDTGITPAHAGKSKELRLVLLNQRDHPRTCGEKIYLLLILCLLLGSPPHMRGKVLR